MTDEAIKLTYSCFAFMLRLDNVKLLSDTLSTILASFKLVILRCPSCLAIKIYPLALSKDIVKDCLSGFSETNLA